MSEVKRYDPINSDGTCGICVEDADYGAYVEYSDYAALDAECEKLAQCLKFARTTMAVVADNANLRGVEYRSLMSEIKRIDDLLSAKP